MYSGLCWALTEMWDLSRPLPVPPVVQQVTSLASLLQYIANRVSPGRPAQGHS